jgi:hypothetical protein
MLYQLSYAPTCRTALFITPSLGAFAMLARRLAMLPRSPLSGVEGRRENNHQRAGM